jgi:hypothetical protein
MIPSHKIIGVFIWIGTGEVGVRNQRRGRERERKKESSRLTE